MIQLVLMLGGYLALLTLAVWLIGAFTGRETSDPPAASRAEGRRKPPPKPSTRRLGAHKGASVGKGATYAARARLAHLREHDRQP
jgi:Na+-transporting methylmalonyl-CoA/oxaloacetate decarboxylase gamma subunit